MIIKEIKLTVHSHKWKTIMLVFFTHYEAIKVCTFAMGLQKHSEYFETIVSVMRQFRRWGLAA